MTQTGTWPKVATVSKRQFLLGAGGLAVGSALTTHQPKATETEFDVIVIGGGNAGLPAAIFAAQRGARVLIVEAAAQLGGSLSYSGGRMSAAGTKLQKSLGIDDHPDIFFEDVMRLSDGTANPDLLRLTVDSCAPAFDWLMDNGFEVAEGTPVIRGMTHEGQTRARYVWSDKGAVGILEVCERVMNPLIASGQIMFETSTDVTRLGYEPGGRVTGVYGRKEDGTEVFYKGRKIALTSGGYASNSQMFEELEGVPDYSDVSNPYSQGIGITLGLSVGGFVRGGEHHLPNFGSIMVDGDIPSQSMASIYQYPPDRQPWEIWVNERGERFIQEDIVSVHAKELALAEQPHERFWVVFDDEIFNAAPPVVRNWTREDMADAFNNEFSFRKADSLPDLANATGINASAFETTVAQYNAGQQRGRDHLGRKHLPRPIQNPPYYAIRVQSAQLLGFAGLAVDNQLRVLRTDMSSVPNLYAAGEVLGAGSLMGQCYFGGMMVTPALALGRRLGLDLIDLQA